MCTVCVQDTYQYVMFTQLSSSDAEIMKYEAKQMYVNHIFETLTILKWPTGSRRVNNGPPLANITWEATSGSTRDARMFVSCFFWLLFGGILVTEERHRRAEFTS